MSIVTFLLALISLPLVASIAGVITALTLGPLEIRLQSVASKDALQSRNSELGERPVISFSFGVFHTTFSKAVATFTAAGIFHLFNSTLSPLFLIVALSLFVVHDLGRICRFLGNPGVWSELGYLVGDLAGVFLGMIAGRLWFT